MIKITGNELKKLIPLYERQGIEESLTEAVLKGLVKGCVHVDDAARPSCALVMHAHAGGIFWLGEEPYENQAKAFAQDVFFYKSDREFCTWMEFGNCPDSIRRYVELRVSQSTWTGRVCFTHDRKAFESAPEPAPCDGISIKLYREGDGLPEEVMRESVVFWDDENGVTSNSAAAVALDAEGNLRGMCISAAVVDGCWEIDISTGKEYRKKGIGYAMAHAYITECLSRGCVPRWNCRRENAASYNLALKLGFKPTNGYDLITWDRQNEKLTEAINNPAQDLRKHI